VILAYVLPLVVLLVLLFGCYTLTHNELLSVCISILGILLYYLILKSAGKSVEKGIEFGIRKKKLS
jgi:positive regulator of sigma E activity